MCASKCLRLAVHPRQQTSPQDVFGAAATSTCFACRSCAYRTTLWSSLLKHERTHVAHPYSCRFCPFRSTLKSSIRIHERTHVVVHPFTCICCSQAFFRRDELHAHLQTHKRELPHECTLCPQRFRDPDELTHHMMIHTGPPSTRGVLYRCDRCQVAFGTRNMLRKHQLDEHGTVVLGIASVMSNS